MAAFIAPVMPPVPSLFCKTKRIQRDVLQNYFSNKKESLRQQKKEIENY